MARIELPGVGHDEISLFLERPRRPLRAFLNRSRLEQVNTHSFVYASRPFGLGRWSIQPLIAIKAHWRDELLAITSTDCRIDGLGSWQKAVEFSFDASLVPDDQVCQASVSAELRLDHRGALALLPSSMLLSLAEQSLDQALARMERRCQKGLRESLLDKS